jgi:hypothetical protein
MSAQAMGCLSSAEVDEAEQVARFEMKSIFFNGLDKSEQHMVPQHIVFLHRLYTKWWMETAVRKLTAEDAGSISARRAAR